MISNLTLRLHVMLTHHAEDHEQNQLNIHVNIRDRLHATNKPEIVITRSANFAVI